MNRLDVLAKERFNGDLKATWSYLLYEVSKEERDYYTKYVTPKQLDIGMTAIRRTSERKNELDELADTKFNGDLKATWKHIFSSDEEVIDHYVSIADKHQAHMAFMMLRDEANKLSKRELRRYERAERLLHSLNMTEAEVLDTPRNPYRRSLLLDILKVTVVVSAIVGLIAFEAFLGMESNIFAILMSILSLVCTLFAFGLAKSIQNFFRFWHIKKH